MAVREELFAELQPLVTTFEGHPWNWAAHEQGERTPRKNEVSRWNNGKDLSFVPLRPERVVEVRYDYMEGIRFRHTAQFERWRPDREPAVLHVRAAGTAGPVQPGRRADQPLTADCQTDRLASCAQEPTPTKGPHRAAYAPAWSWPPWPPLVVDDRRLHAAGLRARRLRQRRRARRPPAAARRRRPCPAPRAQWRPCPEVPQELVGRGAAGMTYDCASVAVPRDWTNAADRRDLRRRDDPDPVRRRSSDRIGSLLLNPGGPGGSGIDTAVYLSFGQALGGLPTEITDQFDIIGFDPRGRRPLQPGQVHQQRRPGRHASRPTPTRSARPSSTRSSRSTSGSPTAAARSTAPSSRSSPPSRPPATWTRSAPRSATRS